MWCRNDMCTFEIPASRSPTIARGCVELGSPRRTSQSASIESTFLPLTWPHPIKATARKMSLSSLVRTRTTSYPRFADKILDIIVSEILLLYSHDSSLIYWNLWITRLFRSGRVGCSQLPHDDAGHLSAQVRHSHLTASLQFGAKG